VVTGNGLHSREKIMSLQSSSTVFLLDDEEAVVVALGRLLQAEGFVTRSWTSAAMFLDSHDVDCPGCLVADMRMPGMSGLELQRALSARGSDRPIVFVTGQGDIPTTVEAMRAGAVTFLSKPVRREDLLAAVREALEKDAATRMQRRARQDVSLRLASLTPRERQVLDLVTTGMLNKQIAARLGAAEKTVKVHRGRVMEKMRVRSAVALVGLLARTESRQVPVVGGLDADVTAGIGPQTIPQSCSAAVRYTPSPER
jgi:FixJ family two-component response regulator